jgi:hypothetical protein
MSVKELKCPKCGASVSRDKNVCDYCKAQYVIEERAVLFGEYGECNTFRELAALKNKKKMIEAHHVIRLLEACKFCHIKSCEFFNKDMHEIFPDWHDRRKKPILTPEEFDELSRKSWEKVCAKNKAK